MDPDVGKRWEEFLDPDNMRPKLIVASIFIAAFELLKSLNRSGIPGGSIC